VIQNWCNGAFYHIDGYREVIAAMWLITSGLRVCARSPRGPINNSAPTDTNVSGGLGAPSESVLRLLAFLDAVFLH
jgi:hypothetical protein